jgi:hypothetical protein
VASGKIAEFKLLGFNFGMVLIEVPEIISI